MISGEAQVKKWGNSLAIIIPREVSEKEKIKVNDHVSFFMGKELRTGEKLFGIGKGIFKKSAQEIKDELRSELYDE